MPRSLLDGVDLRRVRSAVKPRPGGTALACLMQGGVLQHDPADPDWSDRDRLVVGDALAAVAGRAFFQAGYEPDGADGYVVVPDEQAIAVAVGTAAASRASGGVWRAWGLVDGTRAASGSAAEAASAATDNALSALTIIVHGGPPAVGDLLRAAGWRVAEVPERDVVVMLAALDRLVTGDAPGAVRIPEVRS